MRPGRHDLRFALAVALFLALCLRAAAAPVPVSLGPGQPQAYAWQPDESWPGGSLADSRLDRPVRFWRAGLSLPEVFAGIEQQTGVAISVWPPTDPAARMRVTLYLNREQPPTLREAMAQLSWAVRADFACTDGPERRYYLLGIGEIGGEWARLAAAREARDRREQEQARQDREQMVADIEKYRPALALSREEAIRSLQDTDPLLLLTLLSPVRRVTLQLLCALAPEQLAALAADGHLQLNLSDLAAGTRDEISRALRVRVPAQECAIELYVESDGIWALVESSDELAEAGQGERVPLPAGRPLDPYEEVALYGALHGEAAAAQRLQSVQAGQAQLGREAERRAQREFMARVEGSRQLSAGAAKRLAAVIARWDGNTTYPLWRLQEAAAGATGMSVVSDCFSQPAANPSSMLSMLDPAYRVKYKQWAESLPASSSEVPGAPAEPAAPAPPMPSHGVSMLDWLTGYCFFCGVPEGWPLEGRPPGWEWGDAGSFLRFRTERPEVWRGVMLPEPVEEAIEKAIQPYLEMAAKGMLPSEIPFPLDLRTQVWIVGQTDMLQRPGAAYLIWDDPATPIGALHNHLAAAIVGQITQEVGALNWLTTLREDQWETLRTTGITGSDLIDEQQTKWYIARWVGGAPDPEQRAEALRKVYVRLVPSRAGIGLEALEGRGPDGETERAEFFPRIGTQVTVPGEVPVERSEQQE
jgi:hypothetical protein